MINLKMAIRIFPLLWISPLFASQKQGISIEIGKFDLSVYAFEGDECGEAAIQVIDPRFKYWLACWGQHNFDFLKNEKKDIIIHIDSCKISGELLLNVQLGNRQIYTTTYKISKSLKFNLIKYIKQELQKLLALNQSISWHIDQGPLRIMPLPEGKLSKNMLNVGALPGQGRAMFWRNCYGPKWKEINSPEALEQFEGEGFARVDKFN